MKSFFRFFAERHILANLIVIMIVLFGVHTLLQINRSLYPTVDYGRMVIQTIYPGASPEDVELNVTNKIEDEFKNVTGIDKVTSVSMENVSVISIILNLDVSDPDKVKDNIRGAVDRVKGLPREVEPSRIEEWNTENLLHILEVGVTGDVPYPELREYARLFEKKLRDVPGISKIEKFGYMAKEVKVEVSPEKIKKYQIPLGEIVGAIQARNIRSTAGNFESYTSEKNLVTLAQFENPREVEDVIVRSSFDGPLVKISDLAVVKEDFEEARTLSRMNGKPAISFKIFKNESADIIRTGDAVKKLIDEEKKYLPENIQLDYSDDLSKYVSNRFDIVMNNGLIGLILVVIFLTFFLNLRTSFWVAMGIPVSLLGVIFLLPRFGQSLDSLTLTAMILVLGIIVDDAIIIAENIFSHRERGASPVNAAVNGISEVFFPVLTTTATTLVVFAPMFFIPGLFGKFIVVIPLTITLALLISLFEVSVALPAHMMPGLKKMSHKKPITTHRWFDSLRSIYEKRVKLILKLRYVFVALFTLVLLGTFWYAGNHLKFILFPSKMATDFSMLAELPLGNSLEASADKIHELEELVMSIPDGELETFVSRIGYNPFLTSEMPNYATIIVNLTPYTDRNRTLDEIVEDLRNKAEKIDGFKSLIFEVESGGPPVGRPVSIGVASGDDLARKALADSLVQFLSTIEGVKDIQRDDKGGKRQVEIQIDYEKLARFELTVADVARNLRIAYDGEIVTSVRYGEEDIDFRVIFKESKRGNPNDLLWMPIPNRRGRLILLKEVAFLHEGPGPADYRHYDGERTITVEADVDQGLITPLEVDEMVSNHFDLDKNWPGSRFIKGGEIMETAESMSNLTRTFLIALLGIYFILVLLFNSFTQPFLIMVAIPFGIIGVVVTFALHGEPMSFMGMLGTIGLSGVVVNDSLVLVSHLNELRKQKSSENLIDTIATGTSNRLRPVILTTLTTVVGLIPLAYGLGGADPFMAPTALALGYGLLFATPLTLALVPCLYMIQLDIHRGFAKIKALFKSSGK